MRHHSARAPDAGDRLGAGKLHRAEIERGNRRGPAKQEAARRNRRKVDDEDERGGDVGGGEERRQMRARNHLSVAQRRIIGIGSVPRAASPANSPPGRRAEISRLYRSGALYMVLTRPLVLQCLSKES